MGTDEQQQVEQQAATTEAYVQFLEGWRADHDEHQHPASAPAYFSGWNAGAAWQAARYAPLVEAAQARRALDIESEARFASHGVDPLELAAYLATARDVNDRMDAALAELEEQGHDGE